MHGVLLNLCGDDFIFLRFAQTRKYGFVLESRKLHTSIAAHCRHEFRKVNE